MSFPLSTVLAFRIHLEETALEVVVEVTARRVRADAEQERMEHMVGEVRGRAAANRAVIPDSGDEADGQDRRQVRLDEEVAAAIAHAAQHRSTVLDPLVEEEAEARERHHDLAAERQAMEKVVGERTADVLRAAERRDEDLVNRPS